jgi:phenylacetate-coenzyme A ligase PaaK-like adenylate-forming protein
MIWNPTIETMRRPEMKQLQLEKLKKTVSWAYERVPMYKENVLMP